MEIDRERWSGEGDFTERLLAWFTNHEDVAFVRVEDAVADRAEVDYNFISNEVLRPLPHARPQERPPACGASSRCGGPSPRR